MTDPLNRLEAPRKGSLAARPVGESRFLLVAPSGVSALVSSWGAGLVALHTPDRTGRFADIVLGFDRAADYRAQAQLYFGCSVGRVANRIRGASFKLGDTTYGLAANDGPHHLHGGPARSFDKVEWAAEPEPSDDGPRVVFRYVSEHLEEGYPGRLETTVIYTLTEHDELRIDFAARTDRTTPVSLTNHTYWNLSGMGAGSILGHELQVWADKYTPIDDQLIPTGAIEPVVHTALDFRTPHTIGSRIVDLESTGARGYDHNYVLSNRQSKPSLAARLRDPSSGRVLEVRATQPCLQVYSGNLMTPSVGKFGARYPWRSGICLEPQGYPDAVNNPAFGSALLEPDDVYRATTIFALMTE